MTRALLLIAIACALTGCQKLSDTLDTQVIGYAIHCIDGTRYVLMSSSRGMAITPLLGNNGPPKTCTSPDTSEIPR